MINVVVTTPCTYCFPANFDKETMLKEKSARIVNEMDMQLTCVTRDMVSRVTRDMGFLHVINFIIERQVLSTKRRFNMS